MPKSASRLRYFVAGTFLLLAGVTCTDSPLTGPRSGSGGRARVGFAPAFSRAAAEILHGLASFRLEVDNVHLHLEHANGETAKDTSVFVADGDTVVVIEVSVPLNGSSELLEATVELRDGETVLFSGTQTINATAGAPASNSPPVDMTFTGPGALATAFDVGPGDTTIFANDSVVLRPTATDAGGQPVPNLVLAWSVNNAAIGSVSDAGVFKPSGPRGQTYVVARIPSGLKDSSLVHVALPATHAIVVSGADQLGTVGTALPQPIVVELQASDNLPVPGVTVAFSVVTGGGSLSSAGAVTDANGRASVTLTLGTGPGANAIQVSSVGIPALPVSATGKAGNAKKLTVAQQPSATAASGTQLATQPKVQLQDTHGNLVTAANVTVNAALTAANGRTLGGTLTATTDANGVATFANLKISGPPGTASITFTQDTLTSAISNNIAVSVGAASAMTAEGGTEVTHVAGAAPASPPATLVTDAGGNGVPDVPLHIVVTRTGTVVRDTTVLTDATGRVGFLRVPLATVVGSFVVTVSNDALTGSPIVGNLTVTHAAAHHMRFVSQPATTTAATVFSPSVTAAIEDQFNNRVTTGASATAAVTLAIKPETGNPAATLGPNTGALTQNAVAGLATFGVQIDKIGSLYQLTAATSGLTGAASNSFTINPGAPSQMLTVKGNGQGSRSLFQLPDSIVVQLQDAGGNNLAGQSVTFTPAGGGSVTSGPTTTNSNGISGRLWTVGSSGAQTVTASNGSISQTFTAFLAETLVVITQPVSDPQNGVVFPTQPKIQVRDLAGNQVKLAGVEISATVCCRADGSEEPDPTLSGSAALNTNAQGEVSYADLKLAGFTGQRVKLAFGSTGLQGAQSIEVTMRAGPANAIQNQNSGYLRVATGGSQQLHVQVRDVPGMNPIGGESVKFTVDGGLCTIGGSQTATVTTNTNGDAFANADITNPLSSCTVRAELLVGGGSPPTVFQRLYFVPRTDTYLWIGNTSDSWTDVSNWYGGSVPNSVTDAFIPAASGGADGVARNPRLPPGIEPDGGFNARALVTEANAHVFLNGKELYVRDSLVADGSIEGPGILALGTAPTNVRGTVHALLELGETGCPGFNDYVVSGALTANEILANCRMVLADNFNVNVVGDLTTSPRPEVGIGGRLFQTNGTITVGGNAAFNGDESTLTGGLLELKGHFSHTGDCGRRFNAHADHVTRFTTQVPDSLILFWNNGSECVSRFGILELANTGPKGMALRTLPDFNPVIGVGQLRILGASKLNVPSFFSLNFDTDGLLMIELNTGLLRLEGSPPFASCDVALVTGDNTGPRSCTFPAS